MLCLTRTRPSPGSCSLCPVLASASWSWPGSPSSSPFSSPAQTQRPALTASLSSQSTCHLPSQGLWTSSASTVTQGEWASSYFTHLWHLSGQVSVAPTHRQPRPDPGLLHWAAGSPGVGPGATGVDHSADQPPGEPGPPAGPGLHCRHLSLSLQPQPHPGLLDSPHQPRSLRPASARPLLLLASPGLLHSLHRPQCRHQEPSTQTEERQEGEGGADTGHKSNQNCSENSWYI